MSKALVDQNQPPSDSDQNNGQPPYGQPQYGAPQYGQPPYGQPPYGQPQYGQPPYGQPQYGQPQYGQPYYAGLAPKPGCIPLRPLGLGEIISGSVSAIRRNARVVLPISGAVAVVQALLSVWIQASNRQTSQTFIDRSDPNNEVVHWSVFWKQLGVSFGGTLVSLIFAAVLTGVMIVVVTEDVVGRKADFALVRAKLRSRAVRLISLSLFVAIVEVIGLFFCLAPGIWLWGIWAVAIPAMMVENTSFGHALGRSQQLVSGTFWRVWGLRALCFLIASVAGGVVGGIAGGIVLGTQGSSAVHLNFGSSSTAPVANFSTGAFITLVIVGAIVALFTAPFKAAVDSLLYVDLRMRKEGLAVDLQQAAARSATSR